MIGLIDRLGLGCTGLLASRKGTSKVPIPFHAFRGGDVFVLGVYDGLPYPGTDRISMAAPAILMDVLDRLERVATAPRWVVFEGQRFFSANLLEAIDARFPGSRFAHVTASPRERAARRAARLDPKGERFLKAAATQVRNAAAAVPEGKLLHLVNDTPEDRGTIVSMLLEVLDS
jgi:hypothetical protein